MAQASGGSAQITYCEQTAYDEIPSSPQMTLLRAAAFGESLGSTTEELTSNAIGASRSVQDIKPGNIDAGGAIPFELSIDGMGTLLKHALGVATTGRAVTQQPTNVTGVTIDYASIGSTPGNGTLGYADSITSLSWAESGDTTGELVNVSAGGVFTLISNNGQSITVHVDATSLPAGTVSDTDITVSGSLYTHTIKRGPLPIGLVFEKGFTDISQYFPYIGNKIEQLQIAVNPTGLVTGSIDLKGRGPGTPSATPLDATPTDPGFETIAHHEASSVLEGGTAAVILGLEMAIGNALDTDKFQVGSKYRASLPEGQGTAKGTITFLFEDLTYYNKWLNGTETSIKIIFTQGAKSVAVYYPRVRYTGDGAPKIESAGGIVNAMSFSAFYSSVEGSDVVVTITNNETAI